MTHTINKIASISGLLLLLVSLARANVPLVCHTCEGIGCLRTSADKVQTCLDPLDICVTVFDQFNVVRKGCSLEIPVELRKRCENPNSMECHKCNANRCNNLGRQDYVCVNCDSSNNRNCATDAATLAATRCSAPSAPNAYCYVRYEGSVTRRGCATNVREQQDCLKSSTCMLCMPGDVRGCNTVNFTPGSLRSFFIN